MYPFLRVLQLLQLFSLSLLYFTNDVISKKNNIWAILHCGCNEYKYSYGMEASVYKIYNILVENGVPKNQIITITPDEVAYDARNPLPGVVVHATSGNPTLAQNQYEDIIVDYHPKDLNTDLFFQILNGNATALRNVPGSGKVLKTGPEHNIFFYTVSLGTYGGLLLNANSIMWADSLIPHLEELRDKNRFAKMLMYVDSPNAASMFDNYLETSKNIIVQTVGGRNTPMYPIELNKAVGAYTGTLGSNILIKSLERMKLTEKSTSTIFDNFILARNEVLPDLDPLNLYGTLKLGKEKMSDFIGEWSHKNLNIWKKIQGNKRN